MVKLFYEEVLQVYEEVLQIRKEVLQSVGVLWFSCDDIIKLRFGFLMNILDQCVMTHNY